MMDSKTQEQLLRAIQSPSSESKDLRRAALKQLAQTEFSPDLKLAAASMLVFRAPEDCESEFEVATAAKSIHRENAAQKIDSLRNSKKYGQQDCNALKKELYEFISLPRVMRLYVDGGVGNFREDHLPEYAANTAAAKFDEHPNQSPKAISYSVKLKKVGLTTTTKSADVETAFGIPVWVFGRFIPFILISVVWTARCYDNTSETAFSITSQIDHLDGADTNTFLEGSTKRHRKSTPSFKVVRDQEIESKVTSKSKDLKRHEDAIAFFNDMLVVAPKYCQKGAALNKSQKYEEAIEAFDKSIELNPNSGHSYCQRGYSKLSLNRYEEALSDYDRAIDLGHEKSHTYRNRAKCNFALENYDSAIMDYTLAIKTAETSDDFLYRSRGRIYHYQLKQYSEASADYLQAKEIDPLDPENHVLLGHLSRDQGEMDKAEEHYIKAIEVSQNDLIRLDYQISLCNFWTKLGRYQEVVEIYEAQLAAFPENTKLLNSYAWFLSTCHGDGFRDGARAVELATQVCEITEWKSAIYLDTLAAAYAEAGDFDQAVEYQHEAYELVAEKDKEDYLSRLNLYVDEKPYRLE